MLKTKIRLDIPGIGGSLGTCVVCGGTFLMELLLGRIVPTLQVKHCERDLPAHKRCIKTAIEINDTDGDWKRLPEGSLRQAYARLAEQVCSCDPKPTDGQHWAGCAQAKP
jgi:hypothetical protein